MRVENNLTMSLDFVCHLSSYVHVSMLPPEHEGDKHRHQARAPDPAPAQACKPKFFVHTPMVMPERFNLNLGHLKILQKMEVTEWLMYKPYARARVQLTSINIFSKN